MPTQDITATEIAGLPGAVISGEDVMDARRYVVYAWRRNGDILYVGKGNCMSRPLDRNHETLRHMRPSDDLLIWYAETELGALALERRLIVKVKPLFNALDRGQTLGYKRETAVRRISALRQELATTEQILRNIDSQSAVLLKLGSEEAALDRQSTSLSNGDSIIPADAARPDCASPDQLVDVRPGTP